MSRVMDIQCGGCLVWWMSFFTHGVVDVWWGGCLVWWMSGVVVVWCGGCPTLLMMWWMSCVVDVWCGGCLCGDPPLVDVVQLLECVKSQKWLHCVTYSSASYP